MGYTPSIRLEPAQGGQFTEPLEFSGFELVRFETGPGDLVHLYLDRSGPSVAYHDGNEPGEWHVTDGTAIGDPDLTDQTFPIILGQAKLAG